MPSLCLPLRPVVGLRRPVALLALAALLPALVGCAPAPPRVAAGADRPAMVAPPWAPFGPAPSLESSAGMVVSGHPLASQAGAQILERGGNAIDAAVGVGLALAVVLPRAGNLGGGGFLVWRDARGEVSTLDFRETAPAAAHRDMYLGPDGEPTRDSVLGHLASGVPGTVAGLWEMHSRFGRLSWAELVEPAIELARGHVVDAARHADIERAADELRLFAASASQFLPGGEPPPVGEVWRQQELARTLERIAEQGRDGFYRGPTAQLVVAEMERGGGLITLEDLADYRPVWREPVRIDYRDHVIYTMPPPSSGGATLALIFNMLETRDRLPAFGSDRLYHLEAEVMRRAFLERNHWLGDPAFVDVPLARLTSEDYARRLAADIGPRATPTRSLEPGVAESDQTTHYSVVDAEGNAVALTTTINGSFGNKVTVTGAGFLLNNEMDDFAAVPGRPNMFGLVEGEANAVAPGKRMLSSMSPSLVLGPDGELRLVLGAAGGPTIITSVYRVISGVVDHGMTLPQAMAATRIHHQALPDRIEHDPDGLANRTERELRRRGHELEAWGPRKNAVGAIGRHDGRWIGVVDPRREGGAAAPHAQEGAEEAQDRGRLAS